MIDNSAGDVNDSGGDIGDSGGDRIGDDHDGNGRDCLGEISSTQLLYSCLLSHDLMQYGWALSSIQSDGRTSIVISKSVTSCSRKVWNLKMKVHYKSMIEMLPLGAVIKEG